MFVMLKKDWPGDFRRSFGDKDNKQVLQWQPGETIELTTEAEQAAVRGDIGKALVVKEPPVVKVASDLEQPKRKR